MIIYWIRKHYIYTNRVAIFLNVAYFTVLIYKNKSSKESDLENTNATSQEINNRCFWERRGKTRANKNKDRRVLREYQRAVKEKGKQGGGREKWKKLDRNDRISRFILLRAMAWRRLPPSPEKPMRFILLDITGLKCSRTWLMII